MGWVVYATPRLLYPEKRPCSHLTRGRVGPTGGLDEYQRHHPPGFEHPVASRYTDCVNPVHHPCIVISSGFNTKHLLRRGKKNVFCHIGLERHRKHNDNNKLYIRLLKSCQLRNAAQRDEISGMTYINNSVLHCTSLPLLLRNILLHMRHEIP